jgi:DNA gyrase subunit A
MVEKHGDERRSDINPMPLSMDREDLIEERAIVISLSGDDYIRHLPVETFRVQNRGGKGIKGVATKEEDVAKTIISCFSKDRILIFTNKPFDVEEGHSKFGKMDGRVYGIKAWETPQVSRQSKGTHIRNVLDKFQENEKIVSILSISKEMQKNPEGHFIFFATKLGKVKKTSLESFIKINKNGKRALILAQGDELVSVRHGKEDSHVILISSQGRALRFKPSALIPKKDNETGETTMKPVLSVKIPNTQPNNGLKLISSKREKLGKLVGMIVSDDDNTGVLTISKYGMAKRTRVGSGLQIEDLDSEGNIKTNEDGSSKMRYDGFKLSTSKGNQGNFSMFLRSSGQPVGLSRDKFGKMTDKEKIEWHNSKFPDNPLKTQKSLENCWPEDEIVRVHQIPNEGDQIFLLAESGMMIRLNAAQTKETLGKSIRSAGTRVMEVRNKKDGGFIDSLISSARLPAELIDGENENDSSDEGQDNHATGEEE